MAVLFAMPPGGITSFFSEHLGAAFLRAMLARAGIASEAYLPRRNPSLAAFGRFLDERRPSVVGFTAYESNLLACRAMARVVRERIPEAVVLAGGPNATFSPEETLEVLEADACLRGAGEGTIVDIVQGILGAERPRSRLAELLANVPNLVIRTPDGAVRTRQGDLSSFPAERFQRLDDIPSPYRAGLVATADIGYLTARGCNQHCTYCSFAAVSGRRVHYHGVERVLDDLAAFKSLVDRVERRRRTIPICDDTFTLAPQRARAICEGIIRRGLELPYECATRADHVDADLLQLMRRAGFEAVSFGLESAVPRVLRAIGKVRDPDADGDPGFDTERNHLERFRAAVADARRAGLTPSVSVIGGLPGESAEDFRATLAFVESLEVPMYTHNVLTLLPGTPLYEDRERWGLGAERDASSGTWRTTHAYDVRAVPPLGNSMSHAMQWDEANEITDALCGRPRRDRADGDAAWAVVLHLDRPEPAAVAWLRDVLSVNGTVAVVATRRSGATDWATWAGALNEAKVPWGLLALLSREEARGGVVALRSYGTAGEHRFELDPEWSAGAGAVERHESGACRVRIWLASLATEPPPPWGTTPPPPPMPEIADGCRWWSGWRRCRDPRVLHVRADGSVSACWGGPAIGTVGDGYDDLVARGRALGSTSGGDLHRANACPLRPPGAPSVSEAAERYEVAARMSWVEGRWQQLPAGQTREGA